MTARLTGADHDLIERARELAALDGQEIREQSNYADPAMALADAMGRAQFLLTELASLAERLACGEDQTIGRNGEGGKA